MKLRLISIGAKAPSWVQQGFAEYAKRLPADLPLQLQEIAPPKHGAQQDKHMRIEGEKMLRLIRPRDWVVALDEQGERADSRGLAKHLDSWRMKGSDIVFLIGGADGLAPEVKQRADQTLALSNLTFPHYLVRLILAESLYRAWSISAGHPYHRD